MRVVAGVTIGKSRFSSRPACYTGKREFLHFHDAHEVDVRLGRKEIRARREVFAEDERVTMRGTSDWIEVRFHDEEDVERVVELARIALRENVRELRAKR